MYQVLVTALALSCFYGCQQEQDTPPKTVETETIQQAVVNAEASTSQAMPPVNVQVAPPTKPTLDMKSSTPKNTEREPTFQDTGGHRKLVGLSTSFPWAGDRNGGWQGTGHPDPEPLKAFSDEEMLGKASNTADKSDERQHALVSVGRRKMSGAIDALAAALTNHSEIYEVREMGLSGLIEHGGPEALKLMWQALKNDPSEGIRGMAIWGIALYGSIEAEAAIMHGLSDEHPNVKGMAVLAVWSIKDKRSTALSILQDTAKVTERVIWQESLNVLSRMPYPEASAILYQIAKTETGDKQQSAVSYYRTWLRNYPDLAPR